MPLSLDGIAMCRTVVSKHKLKERASIEVACRVGAPMQSGVVLFATGPTP